MELSYEALEKKKDAAYWERNQLVAALSKLFLANLDKHDENDKAWDDDWRTIVYVYIPVEGDELPTDAVHHIDDKKYRQLSWHIHDSEIPMFDHLTYRRFQGINYDYHSTEHKYRRLRALKPLVLNS